MSWRNNNGSIIGDCICLCYIPERVNALILFKWISLSIRKKMKNWKGTNDSFWKHSSVSFRVSGSSLFSVHDVHSFSWEIQPMVTKREIRLTVRAQRRVHLKFQRVSTIVISIKTNSLRSLSRYLSHSWCFYTKL